MRTRWTCNIRPLMWYIGPGPNSGKAAPDPQGYEVEFFQAGHVVEMRSYGYVDEQLMLTRITDWIKSGEFN